MIRPSPERLREVLAQELYGSPVIAMPKKTARRKARCAICRERFYYEPLNARSHYEARKIQRRPLCGVYSCTKAARAEGHIVGVAL